jgi:hypothetical protein
VMFHPSMMYGLDRDPSPDTTPFVLVKFEWP